MDKVELHRASVDLIILTIVSCVAAYFFFVAEPVERGFFCDDSTIKYPFIKYEAVTLLNLICIVFVLPFLVIVTLEATYYYVKRKKLPILDADFAFGTSRLVVNWLLSVLILIIFENIMKVMCGSLRPMFLDACGLLEFCQDKTNVGRYITEYQCNSTVFPIDQLRKSFPSGHAAEAMGSMSYLVYYLHRRFHRYQRVAVFNFQLSLILLALYTGITRLQEFKHHPHDVLAGFFLGILITPTFAKLTGGLDDLLSYDETGPNPTTSSFTEIELS